MTDAIALRAFDEQTETTPPESRQRFEVTVRFDGGYSRPGTAALTYYLNARDIEHAALLVKPWDHVIVRRVRP